MPTLISVISDYDLLSDDDQEKFKRIVLGRVVKSTTLNDAAELRFKDGLVCPKCGCVHVVRNVHDRKGNQRYRCMDCGSTFSATSNSIVSPPTKKPDAQCRSLRRSQSVIRSYYVRKFLI